MILLNRLPICSTIELHDFIVGIFFVFRFFLIFYDDPDTPSFFFILTVFSVISIQTEFIDPPFVLINDDGKVLGFSAFSGFFFLLQNVPALSPILRQELYLVLC